jgi:hypothetical protein
MIDHLTESLKRVVEQAAELSPDYQDIVAKQFDSILQLIEEIDDNIWHAQFRSPEHLEVIRRMAQEARNAPKLPFPPVEEQGKL